MKTLKVDLLESSITVIDYWKFNYKALLGQSASEHEKRAIIENLDARFTELEIAILCTKGRDA